MYLYILLRCIVYNAQKKYVSTKGNGLCAVDGGGRLRVEDTAAQFIASIKTRSLYTTSLCATNRAKERWGGGGYIIHSVLYESRVASSLNSPDKYAPHHSSSELNAGKHYNPRLGPYYIFLVPSRRST